MQAFLHFLILKNSEANEFVQKLYHLIVCMLMLVTC